jgi:hypothetical protein
MIRARHILTLAAVAGSLAVASPASAAEGDPLPGGDPPPVLPIQDDSPPPAYQEGDPLPGGDPPPIVVAKDDSPPPPPQEGDPLPGGDPAESALPVKAIAAVRKASPTTVRHHAKKRHPRHHHHR